MTMQTQGRTTRKTERPLRALLFGLSLCLLWSAKGPPPAFADTAALSQPPNVGDAKIAATAYYRSGDYERDLAVVSSAASAWIAERAPQVDRPAVVFDIDDTALSNWTVISANDFGRVFDGPCRNLPKGPCGWVAWDLRARAPVIPQTMALYKQARALRVAVFFITGRDEPQRAATRRNLRAAGYVGYRGLYMPAKSARYASAADFKAAQRQKIESRGYTIIANIGDQPSDLAGGHAERTFLLPNPYYRIP
jgi:predicted secreted acid phosphatase